MNQKAVLTCAALVSGLVLTGCSPDPQARPPAASPTATAATGATPSEDPSAAAPSPRPTAEEPAPEQPAPEEPAPADPLTAFRSSPEGAPHAGTVTRVERRDAEGGGGVVHKITADVNDRAVAAEICRAYGSAMQTGQDRIEVVDTVDALLAFTPGGSEPCTVQPPEDVGAVPFPAKFSYEEALAAWRNGMPYYDAFCINYDPVTEAGLSQCRGIEAGTVDAITGEYVGG